jgi:hypothetical protein
MKKYTTLFFLLFIVTVVAQDCGFEYNTSQEATNTKMDWFEAEFAKQKLVVSNDKNDIPTQVLQQLQCHLNGFDIANPDEKHQDDCAAEEGLPSLHLSLLAKNENYLVFTYNTYSSGSSSHHIWLQYDTKGIINYWSASTIGILIIDENFNLQKYAKNVSTQVKNLNAILYSEN